MNKKDLIATVWEQNASDMRQMDAQRTTLSNIVLVLDVALIGVLTRSEASPYVSFLAVLLVVLGLFGMLSVAKYYERYKYYKNRAEALLRRLSTEVEADVLSLLQEADERHGQTFKLRGRFKVYRIWYSVHGVAVCTGLYFLYRALRS